MSETALNRILQELDSLESHELEQIGQAVQARLCSDDAQRKRQAFREALLAAGLVKQIKPPRTGGQVRPPLVEVQGTPVSETIIEERR